MIAPGPFYEFPAKLLQKKGVSSEAFDLISKLLEVDHRKRISIKQILKKSAKEEEQSSLEAAKREEIATIKRDCDRDISEMKQKMEKVRRI